MKYRVFATTFVFVMTAGADWRLALPGWQYEFPRDHQVHSDFKSEWWYFTGNLRDAGGRELGFQLTFFRQGVLPPERREPGRSRFLVDDFKFAHFAVSDLSRGVFRHTQKVSRGAFGEAGFFDNRRLAWIDDWTLSEQADGNWHLSATHEDFSIALTVTPLGPPIIHGKDGISQKAAGDGHASHYYSFPRMRTEGRVTLGKEARDVTGETWFDHEWATNQLTDEQAGWNWFSLQFENGSALMLYQMRLRDGSIDPASSGTFISPDGSTAHLAAGSIELVPLEYWKSPATGARYPVRWKVGVPQFDIGGEIQTPLQSQELVLQPIAYWEGAIRFHGTRNSKPLHGAGYMELTGYAGALPGIRAAKPGDPSQ